jgi:hypothetical protein
MLDERPTRESRSEWVGLVAALVGAAVLGSLSGTRVSDTRLVRMAFARVDPAASLSERLSVVDSAIAAGDPQMAIAAWRDAYGLALGTRGWEPMVAVGDTALCVDALMDPDEPAFQGFRAGARRAYRVALFRARGAHAPEGITRVADAFAALGDDEVAARARAVRPEALR